MMRRPLPMLLAGLLAAGACTSTTDAPPLRVESVAVEPAGALVWDLSATLSTEAPLEVRYATPGGPELRVVSAEAGRDHSLRLARLRADATYTWEIVGTGETGTFATGALPDDLAAVDLAVEGDAVTELVLIHLFHPEGFKGWAVVDGGGHVVWWYRAEGFPFGMTRRDDGDFVFLDEARGLLQVTPAGEVAFELPQRDPAEAMHHDVISTPDDGLLFIAFDSREVGGTPRKGEAIWSWRPETGAAERMWTSWDHLSIDVDRGPRFGDEWLHANALHVGPRGNVLVSLHYLNQVASIAPDWSGFEWRLGGPGSTLELDPADGFSGQHTPREVAPGRIVLFDNHLDQGGPSRMLELQIDAEGAAVERVSSWSTPRGNFSTAVSSARRLPGGGTLVGFGMAAGVFGATGPVEVWELGPDGEARWHLTVAGTRVMFRAEPLRSLAGEEVVFPATAE